MCLQGFGCIFDWKKARELNTQQKKRRPNSEVVQQIEDAKLDWTEPRQTCDHVEEGFFHERNFPQSDRYDEIINFGREIRILTKYKKYKKI